MSEKKKGLFASLFKSSGGCGCGVSIVEEDPTTKEAKDKKSNSDTTHKK